MSLVITPGQLAKRAEMYQQLGQLTNAGVGVIRALDMIRRNPPARSYAQPLQQMMDEIARGHTFTQSLQAAGGWLPEFDIALLHAGEQTGRLDASFRHLATYYFDRARMARAMIAQLLYPIGLIHFAVFVFMIILPWAASGMNFDSSLVLLFIKAGLTLSPLYIGTAVIIYAFQSKHGEAWRSVIENILHPIPLLGTARHFLALARLAAALEALISAGVTIVEAWQLAANACGSPAIRRIVAAWTPQFALGLTPAQVVQETQRFPEMFANLYTSGEVSGKLDESLRNLGKYYQEEGARKLQTIANLLPKAIYLIVMLVIAYNIIKFYTGYFAQIQNAGGF